MDQTQIYIIGILGNLLFGFKSLPQVIHSIRTKSIKGLSTLMLLTDFLGNIFCALFIYQTTSTTLWPQYINYSLACLWLIILFILKTKYK
jgi:uncharacterized protein with PQ loop repeat